MTKQPPLELSPIDHHIQAAIIAQLFSATTAVPFNELKPADVQNSLFMYHMNKLESRGVVERSQDGFRLTASGARWANFVSPTKLKPRLTPRPLVKFLIFNEDKTKVVLSRRRSAAAQHINDYLLPSGFHRYGMSFAASGQEVFEKLTGQEAELAMLGVHETIHTQPDGYIHHVIAPLFETVLDEAIAFPEEEHYELLWVPFEEAVKGTYDSTIGTVLQWYMDGKSFAGETFVFDTE